EWEIKQLESKQDKTIVEHVHVLEEAKRVTDRQLQDAQVELQKNAAYIRSLEKAKTRLTGEAEDLVRETERERMELRNKEKAMRIQEERAARALADVERERSTREAAELQVRRLQTELQNAQQHTDDLAQQLAAVQRSKVALEADLEKLADETPGSESLAKIQRQYQTRISQLEEQLDNAEDSRLAAMRVRDLVQRQHAEIRQLIMNSGPKDSSFHSRLLQELQLVDDEIQRSVPSSSARRDSTHSRIDSSPSKSSNKSFSAREHRDSAKSNDGQVAALRQQVEVLEIQMAASERVRHHLESSLREMTSELENSDGSKHFLQQYRARLSRENVRLAELLEDETKARQAAESAQIDGIQAMWAKFQKTLQEERNSYSQLEEARKALRTGQADLEMLRKQLQDATQTKKQALGESAEMAAHLDTARSEISSLKRQLQKRKQEDDISLSSGSLAHTVFYVEMKALVDTFKAKEQSYQERFEAAEIARAESRESGSFWWEPTHSDHLTNALTFAGPSQTLKSLKVRPSQGTSRSRIVYDKVKNGSRNWNIKLEDADKDSSDLVILNQRLAEELEDEKKQHQKDIEDGAFTSDQTRKKYQAELASLSEELQSLRDTLTRLREENRKIRSDYDELQLRFDDEVYNSGGWRKEKERLETKIADVTKAYEVSTAAQSEQQAQIVALLFTSSGAPWGARRCRS
ncbi:hypothetical protein MPER_11125, partial [Moniliophthora perniciosa FA553]